MSRRRPLTRQESQARTRARLVQSAEKVFLQRGYIAASIGEIARDAGYTTGAVYSNFASKEELGLAVLEQHLMAGVTSLQDALAAAEPVGTARLRALESWSRQMLGNEPWIVLATEFVLAARHNPPIRARLAAELRATRTMVTAILVQQRDELGLGGGMDPQRLATAVLGLGMGVAVQRVADPTIDDRIFTESVGHLLSARVDATSRS